jgi:hypothetical protein
MRELQLALIAVMIAALSIVAWELDQIRRELAPGAAVNAGIASLLTSRPETREQRNQRLQRAQQELEEDARAILSTPDPPKHRATK